jgi:hypothetical protein
MKNKLLKKESLLSILSVLILGAFMVIAISSGNIIDTETDYLGDGVYQTTKRNQYDTRYHTFTGKRNEYGQFHGSVRIKELNSVVVGSTVTTNWVENVNFVNGRRHGISTTTKPNGEEKQNCYNMGKPIDCKKSVKIVSTANNAYQVLQSKYPWYQYFLNGFGFDDANLETFFETFEAKLEKNSFEFDEFDDYYLYPEEQMEESSDSIIMEINSWQTTLISFDLVKKNEFRKAVIDRFRAGNIKTLEIIEKTYPEYRQKITNAGATVTEFNLFCDEFDTNMDSFPALVQENPLFIDTIEIRMYDVLYQMYNTSYSDSQAEMAIKSTSLPIKNMSYSQLRKAISPIVRQLKLENNPNDIASLIFGFMGEDIYEADIIKMCMRKAYMLKSGIVETPLVVCYFDERNSETSVNIAGYIVENGGTDVTGRGIVWGTTYNPTINDNTIESGIGIGAFSATISGLTQNDIYYARAFATNSEGTSYGDCVKFSTALTSTINSINQNNFDFDVYPNPAVNFTTLKFNVDSPEKMDLFVYNAIGQLVYQKKLGNLTQGINKYEIDLSGFKSGIYHCTLTNGKVKTTKKLLVNH